MSGQGIWYGNKVKKNIYFFNVNALKHKVYFDLKNAL